MRGLAIAVAGMLLAGPVHADCRGFDFKGPWTLEFNVIGCGNGGSSCVVTCDAILKSGKIRSTNCVPGDGSPPRFVKTTVNGKYKISNDCRMSGSATFVYDVDSPGRTAEREATIDASLDYDRNSFHGSAVYGTRYSRFSGHRQAR